MQALSQDPSARALDRHLIVEIFSLNEHTAIVKDTPQEYLCKPSILEVMRLPVLNLIGI